MLDKPGNMDITFDMEHSAALLALQHFEPQVPGLDLDVAPLGCSKCLSGSGAIVQSYGTSDIAATMVRSGFARLMPC